MLHLHGLHPDENVAGLDRLADTSLQNRDHAGHRRGDRIAGRRILLHRHRIDSIDPVGSGVNGDAYLAEMVNHPDPYGGIA